MHHFEKLKSVAQLALRLALAIVFIYHGYPKLFVARAQWYGAFRYMGFPWYFALIAGIIEFFGGCLLVVGLFTRLVALFMTVEMAVAIWRVHLAKGVFAVGNYQLPLVLAAAAFVLLAIGPGPVSADRALFKTKG